jgi:transposase-like protein
LVDKACGRAGKARATDQNTTEQFFLRRFRLEVHINNCENRASILRTWLSAHRGISKDNFDTYLSLFQLQRNINKLPTIEKIKTKDIKTHQQTMD